MHKFKVIYWVYRSFIRKHLIEAVESTESTMDDQIFGFIDMFFNQLQKEGD